MAPPRSFISTSPFGQGFLADPDANREAYQVGVLEFHSGTVIAIIEDNFHALGGQVVVDLSRLAS